MSLELLSVSLYYLNLIYLLNSRKRIQKYQTKQNNQGHQRVLSRIRMQRLQVPVEFMQVW